MCPLLILLTYINFEDLSFKSLAKSDELIKYVDSNLYIDEKTREREVRPFKYIKGNGEKFILTLDTFQFTFEHCKHMNIFKFIEDNL